MPKCSCPVHGPGAGEPCCEHFKEAVVSGVACAGAELREVDWSPFPLFQAWFCSTCVSSATSHEGLPTRAPVSELSAICAACLSVWQAAHEPPGRPGA